MADDGQQVFTHRRCQPPDRLPVDPHLDHGFHRTGLLLLDLGVTRGGAV